MKNANQTAVLLKKKTPHFASKNKKKSVSKKVAKSGLGDLKVNVGKRDRHTLVTDSAPLSICLAAVKAADKTKSDAREACAPSDPNQLN